MTVGIEQKKGQTVAYISIDIPLKRFRKDLGFQTERVLDVEKSQ